MTDMIERLRATTAEIDGSWMGDTERPIGASCGLLREAAARIAELEAEVARRDSLLAEVKGGIIEGTAYDVAAWEARRAALRALTGGDDRD